MPQTPSNLPSHCSYAPACALPLQPIRGKVRYSRRGGGCSWPAVGVLGCGRPRAAARLSAAAPRRSSCCSLAGRALLEAGLLEVAAAHLQT